MGAQRVETWDIKYAFRGLSGHCREKKGNHSSTNTFQTYYSCRAAYAFIHSAKVRVNNENTLATEWPSEMCSLPKKCVDNLYLLVKLYLIHFGNRKLHLIKSERKNDLI